MKKVLKFSFIAAVAVAAGYTAYSHSQKAEALSDVALSNVEALAGCEIYDSNHTLLVSCEGNEGVCYRVTSTLYCAGKRIK